MTLREYASETAERIGFTINDKSIAYWPIGGELKSVTFLRPTRYNYSLKIKISFGERYNKDTVLIRPIYSSNENGDDIELSHHISAKEAYTLLDFIATVFYLDDLWYAPSSAKMKDQSVAVAEKLFKAYSKVSAKARANVIDIAIFRIQSADFCPVGHLYKANGIDTDTVQRGDWDWGFTSKENVYKFFASLGDPKYLDKRKEFK